MLAADASVIDVKILNLGAEKKRYPLVKYVFREV